MSRVPGANNDALERRLIWLVGAPRTGSSWLLNLLDFHEHIRTMSEPLIGAHLALPVSSIFAADPLDLRPAQHRVIDRFRETDDYFFSERYRPVWEPQLRTLVLARLGAQFHDLGGDASTDYLLVKEPNGSEGIDLIEQVVPGCWLLVLVRDGRDVVDSMLDGVRPGGWATTVGTLDDSPRARSSFLDTFARLWVRRTQTALGTLNDRQSERGLLLRYEDLLADTRHGLRSVYSWLDLVTPDNLEDHIKERAFGDVPEAWRGSGQFHRAATPGLWREHFSTAEQRHLTDLMGPTLAELGYEL